MSNKSGSQDLTDGNKKNVPPNKKHIIGVNNSSLFRGLLVRVSVGCVSVFVCVCAFTFADRHDRNVAKKRTQKKNKLELQQKRS